MQEWGIWNSIKKNWLCDKDFNLYIYNNYQVADLQALYFQARDKDQCPIESEVYYKAKEFSGRYPPDDVGDE